MTSWQRWQLFRPQLGHYIHRSWSLLGKVEPRKHIPIIIKGVKTVSIPRLKDQSPKKDPFYAAAAQRTREAVRRLQEAGIIDSEGRRIRQDLPPDMQEGQDRDFGG